MPRTRDRPRRLPQGGETPAVRSLLGAALVCLALATASVVRGDEAAAPASQPASAPPPTDFVGIDGARFVVGGRAFRFVGANVAVMHGPRHRAALEATLDAVHADGLQVIRVWAFGEQPESAAPWARDYAFRLGPAGWVEESFVHLDRVIEAARARELRVILVLGNRWADYGGAPQYLAWAGHEAPRDAGGAPSILALPTFLADPTARAQYLEHVRRVVARTSSLTGVAYRDDPTILSWEIVNELDAPPRARGALVSWVQQIAREIHGLDPHHLVGAGHIGYVTRAQRESWLAVHRLPEIDYADAHAYPTSYDRVRTLRELDDYVDDPVQLAHHVLHKPFVWGEVGFSTRRRAHAGLRRTRWWERFLERSSADGVDGALAWIYATSSDRPHDHGLDVDGDEVARTADVRRVLRRFSRRWRRDEPAAPNPRLTDARGEAPLWDTTRTVRGVHRAHRAARDGEALAWSIEPARFAEALAEQAGSWDGGALAHVYASGAGEATYRLETPRHHGIAARRVMLRVRASSELPGNGEGRTAEDASELVASIDGVVLGRVEVVPDDGLGTWVEIASNDAELAARLARPGVHELRLSVPAGPRGNGLCLYGDVTGREPLPTDLGDVPGRIILRVEP